MKRGTSFLLATIAAVLAMSLASHADSDGNFCTSNGYLAYELRQGITKGAVGHVVRVISFDSEHGIRVAGEATLPEFQVHAMRCSADRIEVSGWDETFVSCIIEPTNLQTEKAAGCAGDPERKFDSRRPVPDPPNLGEFARPGSTSLQSMDPDHTYQLLISSSVEKLEKNIVRVHHKSEVVQIDVHGHVSQRLIVHETLYTGPDSCGS